MYPQIIITRSSSAKRSSRASQYGKNDASGSVSSSRKIASSVRVNTHAMPLEMRARQPRFASV
ncbi:MAG: hypothetical protein C0497_02000 [Gemmatimonas sp.]|nr:hypothetical protein [Gemmatimonas sp.]